MTDAPKGPPCCPVGARSDAGEIDAAILQGGAENSVRKMAERFGISAASVQRHSVHVKAAAGTLRNAGDTSRNVGESPRKPPTLRGKARKLFRRVERLLERAEEGDEAVDLRAAAGLARELRGVLELQARMDGEIKNASTTVNVYQTADWQAVKALLVEALTPFPEAALAVAEVIEAQEQSAPSAPPRRPPSPLN